LDAGPLALASVSASIAAGTSHTPNDVRCEVAKKALLLLARTDLEAAANALAGLLMAGTNRLVAEALMPCGNVAMLRITLAVKGETTSSKTMTPKDVAKLRVGLYLASMTHAEIEKMRWSLFVGQFDGLAKLGSGCRHAANFSTSFTA
jgi:hypothetical protein